jgi:preprotein translocase subunit SecD
LAENTTAMSARRKLAWLAIIAIFFGGLLTWGTATNQPGASFSPELSLDLQGGTQLILTPTVGEGEEASLEQLNQAVSIIRQRIDGSGVGEAQVTVQGEQNIVVAIPGTPDANTLQLIKASALLEFRPVLVTGQSIPGATETTEVEVGEPSLGEGDSTSNEGEAGSATESEGTDDTARDPEATPDSSETSTEPDATDTEVIAPAPDSGLDDTPAVTPTDASDPNWITPALQAEFDALDCTQPFRAPGQVDDPALPIVTCDDVLFTKYILGPVEVRGENISDASSGTITTQTGASTNTWAVNLEFDATGTEAFGAVTSRLFPLAEPRNQFAIVLDGYVITAPRTNAVILNGQAQITGSFTQETSTILADQLKYGALPIGFEVQSQENISATLGTDSLRAGLIAGLIGLGLVMLFMIYQYRGLAVVVIGSLVIGALLVYLAIAFLSWRQGYRLSLAGVTGIVVAIGIMSDSFIVYFERIRDELREGRTLEIAVEAAWKRALRTILVSGAVSFTAAVVLFLLTSANVRGFAFTLGLITLIDLLVFVLFTHPLVQLFARMNFFKSGSKLSGFEVKAVAASYIGRGQFRAPTDVKSPKVLSASREARKRQTIAERKAAQIEAEKNG